ncbi:MAG: hypothetical protein RQ875_13230 [Vicingaceae bacterium]|nr:hypothetical protein [Vicingaceae bacterium]
MQSQSNDDIIDMKIYGSKFVKTLKNRYNNNCNNYDLFGTMCPSMEQHNNFIDILNDLFFNQFNEINLFLIEYKWECHAKLCINNIINSAKKVNTTKLNIYTINGCFKNNEAGSTLICNDIVNILNTIY